MSIASMMLSILGCIEFPLSSKLQIFKNLLLKFTTSIDLQMLHVILQLKVRFTVLQLESS